MCRDPQSFQTCYGADKQQCLTWADQAVKACLREMPSRPMPPPSIADLTTSEFGKWNVLLGHCSEEYFENAHTGTFKPDTQCGQLLADRQLHRISDARLLGKTHSHRGPGAFKILGMTMTPLFFGLLAMTAFLRWRSRKTRVSILAGLFSWFFFFTAAFVGELASHSFFPALYAEIGDNPGQVGGFLIALLGSFILNPLAWLYYRWRYKSQVKPVPKL
jgi:hypothetical protein